MSFSCDQNGAKGDGNLSVSYFKTEVTCIKCEMWASFHGNEHEYDSDTHLPTII
jgi:hypothetical protein